MWAPGIGELVIVLVIVLVLFGPGKLPTVGKSLGTAISQFKSSIKGSDDETENSTGTKEESTE